MLKIEQISADIFKHKINRKLNSIEHNNKLLHKERVSVEPQSLVTVINLNSNYMETIDWRFDSKGINSTATIICAILHIYFIVDIYLLEKIVSEPHFGTTLGYLNSTIMICASIYLLCKEAFSYTHYPIRLNRRNRMIHVFRQDGSVLSAPWDSIFFCAGRGNASQHEIQGHILHEGTEIIRETFCFAHTESSECKSASLLPYWEFVRRYMEEGPESIIEHVDYCPVIADRHESFHNYWQYRTYFLKGKCKFLQILFFFDLLFYPFRWFAMRTSKIPVWPEHIQQQCPVNPDDLYIRNASTNKI